MKDFWISVRILQCVLISSFLYIPFTTTYAQVTYEPLNHQLKSLNGFAQFNSETEESRESSFKPNLNSDVSGQNRLPFNTYIPVDSYDSSVYLNEKKKEYSWLKRKLLYEHFIIIDTGDLHITIDPLLNVESGQENHTISNNGVESENKNEVHNNTRGILIRADFSKKFSVETYFYENQSVFPSYVSEFVNQTDVVPGQGRVKTFKDKAYDYAMSGGYFTYTPWKSFNMQFGHHKQFIGDGYRSLLLSDNSFNYPFLRLNFWSPNNKWSYSILYMAIQDLERVDTTGLSEGIFNRRAATYHVIEYRFSKKLRINLTQGIIYPMADENGKASFDPAFINPLILTYPAFNGMDSKNNVILGLGFKLNPIKQVEIYGQAVADDNQFQRKSGQIGSKVYIKGKAFVQLEGNFVSEYMYGPNSADNNSYNNAFAHYNQSMAHTLGNNFDELILRTAYRYKRLIPSLQVNYFYTRINTSNKVIWSKAELAYVLNPSTNLKIFANYIYRIQKSVQQDVTDNSQTINFGIKTDLRNLYYDF